MQRTEFHSKLPRFAKMPHVTQNKMPRLPHLKIIHYLTQNLKFFNLKRKRRGNIECS